MLPNTLSGGPRRVLITGGMGFIGSHLTEVLLKQGQYVTVIDDQSTGRLSNIQHVIDHPRFSYSVGSIMDEPVLNRLVENCDIIYHLAAAVGVSLVVENPLYTIETNVIGTEMVLKAALRHHAKVFIASTSEVYGKGSRIPFAEDDDVVLGPTRFSRWSYAASKMLDEFQGLAYYHQRGVPVVVARLFNTVGPRQTGRYGMVIPRFVQAALQGKRLTVYGDGQQSRCFAHVYDVVDAIVRLVDCPTAVGKVFNIGSQEEVSILELAYRVLRSAGYTGALEDHIALVPYREAYAEGFEDMRRRIPDTTRIRVHTGWQPQRSLDDILSDVIAYFTLDLPAISTQIVAREVVL
jgi:UDP-glucose 4-epimerase